MTALTGIGGERYWVHIPATKPRAYKKGGLVAAAKKVKGSPLANEYGDSELVHVNKYEMEQLRQMWGEPGINPETGLPAYGFFSFVKKAVTTVAKIGATIALTPVLGPVGASAAVNAVSTAIGGGDLGDIVKSAGFAAATAGAGQLGAKFAPDIGISADVGRAIGAGFGATGAGLVTGQSLEDALTGGAIAGIGTYGINRTLGSAINNNTLGLGDLYQGLTNIGYDISNATGIGGGGSYGINTGDYGAPGDNIVVTAPAGTSLTYTGPTGVSPVTSASVSDQPPPQKYDEEGNILVTAPQGTNLTLGPGIPKITTGIGGEELNFDNEGNPIIVTGTQGPGVTLSPDVADTVAREAEDFVPQEGEIVVNAPVGPGLTLPTGPTTTPTTKDVSASDPYGEVMPFYPSTTTTSSSDKVVPLVPRGGLYAERPMNRGLASISFDPFTYGQATGNQPGEFLFFKDGELQYGDVGDYTGPTSGIGGGGTTGGTRPRTPPGTPPGGTTTTGGTPWTAPPGFTGVGPNTKVGDKQVVDGKTYVWGGDGVGWQWLATDANGNQVLMPGNGATNVSSIESMFKSGVMRPANEAEKARLAEIDRIMTAADTAKTAAEANKILPGVYFDIDAATARAINRPDLVGTQMSQRELQEAKLAADAAARARTAAQIPTQMAAAQAAPKPGMTAQSYYMDYVTPLASSYYSTGQWDSDKARGLQRAVEPFVSKNDLSGAQNAVNNYLSGITTPSSSAPVEFTPPDKGPVASPQQTSSSGLTAAGKALYDWQMRNQPANDPAKILDYVNSLSEAQRLGTYATLAGLTTNADQIRHTSTGMSNYDITNELMQRTGINIANDQSTTPRSTEFAEGGEVEGDDMVAHLIAYHKNGGHQGPGRVKGIGSGQDDKIPAWLSDGEYVWSAQDVADLGDGSTDEGVRRLDKMRQMVRKQAGRKDVKKIAKPQHGIDKMLKAVGGAV